MAIALCNVGKERGIAVNPPTTEQDAAELAETEPYQFQWWALSLVGASPMDRKKGADKGIDGRLYFVDSADGRAKTVIISVKAGKRRAGLKSRQP
jgi:hypothetical protein